MKLSHSMEKVLEYLVKHYPAYSSPASMGAEINGQGAKWAAPVCAKLGSLVERDQLGHYRITPDGMKAVAKEE